MLTVPGLRALLLVAVPAALVGGTLPAVAQQGQPIGGPLLTGPVAVRAQGTPPLPKLTARSWLVADATTGEVLAARSPHRRMRAASTLKLLTTLVLLPRLDPRALHVGTLADTSVEGSRVGIVPGVHYRVDELWHGLLMQSGNDAAQALAEQAGGVPRTVAAMNARADELGALDTRAVNPSGLDAPGQVSSAYDLALVMSALLASPRFLAYERPATFLFPGKPRWVKYQIRTQNRLLGRLPGALAGKTGYTTLAGNTFVAAAQRGNRRLVAVVLRPTPGHHAWAEAGALMEWGFRAGPVATAPVGRLVRPGEVAAADAATSAAPPSSLDGPDDADATVAAPTAAIGVEPRDVGPTRPLAWGVGGLAVLTAVVALLRLAVLRRRRRRRAARRPPAAQPVGAGLGSGPPNT